MTTSARPTPPPPAAPSRARASVLDRRYAATTVGTIALVFFAAFEALAVTTIMPQVARELDGVRLYALSFAAPFASGIVGMVATGIWSDRHGPVRPLLASVALFAAGLAVCGLAPTMEVLVAGRLVQGLGAGGLTVGLYVLVGLVYPARLQPSIFAGFAAAWVLPSLFGPTIAAVVAGALGWQWVFLGVVGLVAVATVLIVPALSGVRGGSEPSGARLHVGRLGWAVVAAVAVLSLDLLGARPGLGLVLAVAAAAVALVAVRPLVPSGTLASARGLPSIVLNRGALGATFFSAEAYVPFVLQDHWQFTTGEAGLALAVAGVSWAGASQVQARLGERLDHTTAMVAGAGLLLAGTTVVWLTVFADLSAAVLIVGYAVAAVGMGTSFPRTGVAMLSHSTRSDRGFNSAAISVADSLGAALALAVCGVTFALVRASQATDPFLAVLTVSLGCAVLAVLTSRRTGAVVTE